MLLLSLVFNGIGKAQIKVQAYSAKPRYLSENTQNKAALVKSRLISNAFLTDQCRVGFQVVLWNPDTLEQHRKLQCAGAVTSLLYHQGALVKRGHGCYLDGFNKTGKPPASEDSRKKERNKHMLCPRCCCWG